MPWQSYPDTDDIIHDWLKSLYTPYRTALPDPTVLPAEEEITWDSYWGGTNTTSVMVYEENTQHRNLGLGSQSLEFTGTHVIRVSYRWIGPGKPPELKQLREFVTRKLHENCLPPLPAVFTSAGIIEMWPTMQSRLYPVTTSAQGDFWIFEVRVNTKILNSIV